MPRGGHRAVEGIPAEEEAQDRHRDDADQDRAAHAQAVEGHDQHESQHRHDRGRFVQVAGLDQGRLAGHHDAGVLQRDQGQEHAQADRDRHPQRARDAVHDHGAQAEDGHQDEQAAGQEHRAQRRLPRHLHAQHHGIGEIGVQAHPRGHRDRVVRVQTHHRAAERRHQAGGHEHGFLGHAGVAEDGGVHEDDVGHRQEGGQAGQHFGAGVAAAFAELE
jgi:hypothetical protein